MAAPRKKPGTRKRAAPKKSAPPGLHERGARVVSVFGAFASRALVEMPVYVAAELFDGPLDGAGRTDLVAAVERDLAEIAEQSPELAESGLAATALELAYQLQHPFNSATAKSMCARTLVDALKELRELAPPKQEETDLDRARRRRADRLARLAAPDAASSS